MPSLEIYRFTNERRSNSEIERLFQNYMNNLNLYDLKVII